MRVRCSQAFCLLSDPEIDLEMDGEQREEMLALLREYRDTFPKDLPMKLPPERLINHEIDLDPYATQPSKRPSFAALIR